MISNYIAIYDACQVTGLIVLKESIQSLLVMYSTVHFIFSIANGNVARFLRNKTVAAFNVTQKETESK
jgi:hypothetical protein